MTGIIERFAGRRLSPRRPAGSLLGLAALGLALIGCGAASRSERETTPRPGDLSTRTPCVTEGADVRVADLDDDDRPEIRHVHRGGARHCSEYDLNRDGRADVVRFYASDGITPEREEHDFDFDGRVDLVRHYEGGALVRQELDTDFDHVVDTWLWCEGGRVARAERDRFRRGAVDLWEEYEGGVLVRARYDDDRDGVPEKFEHFEAGRLVAIAADTNGDGEPDTREDVPPDSSGPALEPLYCDLPEAAAEGAR